MTSGSDSVSSSSTVLEPRASSASRLKPFAFVVVVFLLGGVAGGAAARAYTLRESQKRSWSTPEARVESRLDILRHQLGLSDEQVQTLTPVMLETETERERVMKPCRPELDSLRQSGDSKIVEYLDPGQRAEYEAIRARRKRK